MAILTNAHHAELDTALGVLLTAYGGGKIEATDFIANVMHMVAAVDDDNLTEVASFIRDPMLGHT